MYYQIVVHYSPVLLFLPVGRSMIKKALTRSHDMAESGSRRHRFHEDRPNGNRKLKNKIKFLFKIHQYETS